MNNETELPINWTVRFETEQLEFKYFSAAVSYADSLALSRTLIKHIDVEQQLIELAENRPKSNYEFDDHVNQRSDG